MKYLRVNWDGGLKEGYFIQPDQNYDECIKSAISEADYNDIDIINFQIATEDDYEDFLKSKNTSWWKSV